MGGAARRRVNRAAAAPATDGVCAFCGSNEQDETTVGRLYVLDATTVHYYCALLSCGLVQHGNDEEGLFGFLLEDILAELQRGKKLKCSYCGIGGATVGCCLSQCRKMFHLPCGRRRGSVSIFCGSYSSYCIMHAPMQLLPDSISMKAQQRKALARKSKPGAAPASGNTGESCEDAVCAICYEDVESWPSTTTFWPPCCARDRWLHMPCVQRMALSAGMHYLKCPLCNDKDIFQKAAAEHGVYIPDRRWELKLCLMCGSVAVHLGCLQGLRHVCAQCATVPHPDLDVLESIPLTRPPDTESSAPEFRPLMSHRLSVQRTKPASAKPNSSSTLRARASKLDRVVKIIKLQNDDDVPDIDVDVELADEPCCSKTQSEPNSTRAITEKPKYSIIKWLLENDTDNPSSIGDRVLTLERDQTKTRTEYKQPNKPNYQNYNCLWKELIDKNSKMYETNELVGKNNKHEVSAQCTGLKIKEKKVWENNILIKYQSNVPLNTKYLENGTNSNDGMESDNSLNTSVINDTIAINDVEKVSYDEIPYPKTSLRTYKGCNLEKSHKNNEIDTKKVEKLETIDSVSSKKDGNVNTDNEIFSPKRSLRSDSPYDSVTDMRKSAESNNTFAIEQITDKMAVHNVTNEKIMIINNASENPHNALLEQTLTVINNEILLKNSCSNSNKAIFKDNQDDEIIDLSKSHKFRHDSKQEKVVEENSTTVKTLDENSTKEEMPILDDTPKKALQKTMLNALEDKILSPLKMIEQKIYAKLTDGDSGEFKLRIDQTVRNMKKPRPMSIKKKVIEDILEDLLEDCAMPSTARIEELINQETMQNESVHRSLSVSTALFNETSKLTHSTPSTDNLDITEQSTDKSLTIDLSSSVTRRISICSDNDDTLNSSTDSTKVEIQDSALEISCKEKVSINFVHPSECDSVKMKNVKERSKGIFDEYDLEGSDYKIKRSHIKLKKKEFVKEDTENVCESADTIQNTKISPKTSEKLKMYGFKEQNYKALTEFESLKSRYLSEVGQYKCSFNHKHNTLTKITKPRIKTVIDFAIEAAIKKRREVKGAKTGNKSNVDIDAAEKFAKKSENDACKLDKSQLKCVKKVEFSSNTFSISEKNTLTSDNSVLIPFVNTKQTISEPVTEMSMPEKVIRPRKSIEVLQNLITVFENTNASSGNIILPSFSDLGTSLSPEKSNISQNPKLNNSGVNNTEGTVKKKFSPEKQIVVLHETVIVPEESKTHGTRVEKDSELKRLLAKPSMLDMYNTVLDDTNKNSVSTLQKSIHYKKVQTVEYPRADRPSLEKDSLRQMVRNNIKTNFESSLLVDLTDKPCERTTLSNEIQNIDQYKSILYEKPELTKKLDELDDVPPMKRQDDSKRKRESSVGNKSKKVKLQEPQEITKTNEKDVADEMVNKCTKRQRKKRYAKEIENLQISKNIEIPIKRGKQPKQLNYRQGIKNLNEKKGMCDTLIQELTEKDIQKEITEKNKIDDEKRNERINEETDKKQDLSIQCEVKSNSGKKKLKYKTLAEVRNDIHNNTDRIDLSKRGKKEKKHNKTNGTEYQNTQTHFVEEITETQKQKILEQKRKYKQQEHDEPKTKQKKRCINPDQHDFVNELHKVNEFYRKDKKKKKHQNTKTLQLPIQIAPKLKQSTLNFSPDSKMTLTTPPNDKTVTPSPVTQKKKKKLNDFSPDGLKQTTLNNFFSLQFTLN